MFPSLSMPINVCFCVARARVCGACLCVCVHVIVLTFISLESVVCALECSYIVLHFTIRCFVVLVECIKRKSPAHQEPFFFHSSNAGS